jgi:hypothetical protein
MNNPKLKVAASPKCFGLIGRSGRPLLILALLTSPLSADYYDTWNTQYQLQRAAEAQEEIADTQQLQYVSQYPDPCRYIDMGEYLCDENGCEQYAIKTCPQTIPIENVPLNKRVVPYSESDLKKVCR